MPELPEVENTRRYLVKAGLPGRTLTGAYIGWTKAVQRPSLDAFVTGLKDGRVQAVGRRGKYILVNLHKVDSPTASTLIIHLGMTGELRIQPNSQSVHPLLRHSFPLDDGCELRFIDGRKFGKLWLAHEPEDVLPRLGPEPLGGEFTSDWLTRSLGGRNAPVKALLLEQSIVAGMGNLYADESLFLAGIHPLRPAAELSAEEITRLREAIIAALTSAVQKYDASRDEHWPDPPFGLSPSSIHRKDGAPCSRCEGPISAIRVRGRGTCFCPGCQG